jgi:hypothetical protein
MDSVRRLQFSVVHATAIEVGKLSLDALPSLKYREVQLALSLRKLPVVGTKAVLLAKLEAAIKKEQGNAAAIVAELEAPPVWVCKG